MAIDATPPAQELGFQPSGNLPVAIQLADHLRHYITRGVWGPGQRLPSMPALARECGTSVFPISQALQRLRGEGLVLTKPGSGTYVAPDLDNRQRVIRVMLDLPNVDKILAAFRRERPEFIVIADRFIKTAPDMGRLLGSSAPPDVVSFSRQDFVSFADRGLLSPIDWPSLAEGEQDTLVNIEHMFRFRETYLGVAMFLMPLFVVARRSVFESSGEPLPKDDWTGEEMLDVAKRLTRDTNGDDVLDQFGYLVTPRGVTWYLPFHALGGSMDSWEVLASDMGRAAVRKVWDAIFRARVTPPLLPSMSARYGEVVMAAVDMSRVAMLLADPYSFFECRKRFGDDLAPLRSPFGVNGRRASLMTCDGVGIPARAVNKDGAMAFIRFLRTKQGQSLVCKPIRRLPIRIELWEDMLEGDKELAWMLLQEATTATLMHKSENIAEMAAIQDSLVKLFRGQLLLEEFEALVDREHRARLSVT